MKKRKNKKQKKKNMFTIVDKYGDATRRNATTKKLRSLGVFMYQAKK